MVKQYVTAEQLLEHSFTLGKNIIQSGYKPDFIIGVWRGGAPVGIALQEYLKYFNIKSDHISIRTSSYVGEKQSNEIKVHGLEYIVKHANTNNTLLLVDDIFDSGRSIKAIIDELTKEMRNNLPKDIRIATAFYKPQNNKTNLTPHYYVEVTSQWIVFPHELEDMSLEEIGLAKGPTIAKIVNETILFLSK